MPPASHSRNAAAGQGRTTRRTFLATAGTFVAGLATGVGGTYGAELLSAKLSPAEIADAGASEPPVRTIVVPERNQPLQGELWIFPGSISQTPDALAAISGGARTFDEFHDRLYRANFHDAAITLAKLLVEGRRNAPVRIIDIRASIVRRDPLDISYSIIGPGAEGGTQESISLGFNLSDRYPVARTVKSTFPNIEFGDPFFSKSNTELERGEQEVYSVTALAAPNWDIQWELEIVVVAPGATEPVSVVAQRAGKPFRTIAAHYKAEGGIDFEKYQEVYTFAGDVNPESTDIRFTRSSTF